LAKHWAYPRTIVLSAYLPTDPDAKELLKTISDSLWLKFVHKRAGCDEEAASIVAEWWREKQSECEVAGLVLDKRTREVFDLVPTITLDDGSVLIVGETGTGKEEFARRMHDEFRRTHPSSQFRALNCAALSDELLISELFGHVRGAYTGADYHRLGFFLEASGAKPLKAKREGASVEELAKALYQVFAPGGSEAEFWKSLQGAQLDKVLLQVRDLKTEVKDILKAAYAAEYINLLRASSPPLVDVVTDPDGPLVRMGRRYSAVADGHGDFLTILAEGEQCFDRVGSGSRGTLFLDEVAELPAPAQAALLRVLDGRGFHALGYSGPAILPNVRILAATNRFRTYQEAIQNKFREDLYFRLSRWVVRKPSLRELDSTTISTRVREMAKESDLTIDQSALDVLHAKQAQLPLEKRWLGNWRQVEHVTHRAIAFAKRARSRNVLAAHIEDACAQALEVAEYENGGTKGQNSPTGSLPEDLANLVLAIEAGNSYPVKDGKHQEFFKRFGEQEVRAVLAWLIRKLGEWPQIDAKLGLPKKKRSSLENYARRRFAVTVQAVEDGAFDDLIREIVEPVLKRKSQHSNVGPSDGLTPAPA
jgi:transcriptional regulator with GAF, ATPase, and Fis domain